MKIVTRKEKSRRSGQSILRFIFVCSQGSIWWLAFLLSTEHFASFLFVCNSFNFYAVVLSFNCTLRLLEYSIIFVVVWKQSKLDKYDVVWSECCSFQQLFYVWWEGFFYRCGNISVNYLLISWLLSSNPHILDPGTLGLCCLTSEINWNICD